MITDAMQEKQRIVQAAQEEAKMSANQIIEEARLSIQTEKEKALREVRNEVANLALDIAEKVIGEQMKDKELQKDTINRLISNL